MAFLDQNLRLLPLSLRHIQHNYVYIVFVMWSYSDHVLKLCVCVLCGKPGSQYDAGASVVSRASG